MYWDKHRGPIEWMQPGLWLALVLLLVCGVYLFRSRDRLDVEARALLLILSISTFLALVAIAASQSSLLPEFVLRVMPGRFVNLSIHALPAVLVGLFGLYQSKGWGRLLFAGFLAYPLWNWFYTLFLESERFNWTLAHWEAYTLAAFALMAMRFAAKKPKALIRAWPNPLPAAVLAALLAGILILRISDFRTGLPLAEPGDTVFSEALNEIALIIPPAGSELIQLRFGRAVALNTGGLDQVVYVPSSGPAMERMLVQIYGVDLLNPPSWAFEARPGSLLPGVEARIWSNRSASEWRAIGDSFGATHVLSSNTVLLNLNSIAQDDEYTLYKIPE